MKYQALHLSLSHYVVIFRLILHKYIILKNGLCWCLNFHWENIINCRNETFAICAGQVIWMSLFIILLKRDQIIWLTQIVNVLFLQLMTFTQWKLRHQQSPFFKIIYLYKINPNIYKKCERDRGNAWHNTLTNSDFEHNNI